MKLVTCNECGDTLGEDKYVSVQQMVHHLSEHFEDIEEVTKKYLIGSYYTIFTAQDVGNIEDFRKQLDWWN